MDYEQFLKENAKTKPETSVPKTQTQVKPLPKFQVQPTQQAEVKPSQALDTSARQNMDKMYFGKSVLNGISQVLILERIFRLRCSLWFFRMVVFNQ